MIKAKDPPDGLAEYTQDDDRELDAFILDFKRSFYFSECSALLWYLLTRSSHLGDDYAPQAGPQKGMF